MIKKFIWIGLLLLLACTPKPPPDENLTASGPGQKPPDLAAFIQHLKTSGLPIGRADIYTAENDPFKRLGRPGQYVGKVVWHDTRFQLPPENFIEWGLWGGTAETFSSAEDLNQWKAKIKKAQDAAPAAPPEYQYEKGLMLVRLGGVLTPDQAKAYEAALNAFQG